MKAMILAAGLGTRLRPYTEQTPKPLFTIANRPVLGITIERLRRAGYDAVMVNTHHQHRRIEDFLNHKDFAIRVHTRYEPEILGTGGGIRNIADFWESGPLLVINGDIISDIDLAAIHAYHQSHPHPVTMAMHDHDAFNSVAVDESGFITGFGSGAGSKKCRRLAFTGIHVLDRRVLDFLPSSGPAHIIDAYQEMIEAGLGIKSYEVQGHRWFDIGTPESYIGAVYEHLSTQAFEKAFGRTPSTPLAKQAIAGDGSDRQWYRLSDGKDSLVMVAHGIREGDGVHEVDAYVDIGRHLADCQTAVPRILAHDRHAGLVLLQDVGDTHLQSRIAGEEISSIRRIYRRVIQQWITMATKAADGFDAQWCHQTPYYDEGVVLRNECRYFMEAFVGGFLHEETTYADLRSEFEALAKAIMAAEVRGFIHRDFQSRNIMVWKEKNYFIDFQGGRIGPIQYDLASLLIDPYAGLDEALQEELLLFAAEKLEGIARIHTERFIAGYRLCALSRNLQILGAFAFLSRTKMKPQFEQYIFPAVQGLAHNLSCLQSVSLPKLNRLAARILKQMKP